MKRIPCSGCSLLCDDIIIRSDGIFIDEVIGACIKGKEHFDQVTAPNRITNPIIREDNNQKKIDWNQAYIKAVEMIKKAKHPLLYGFSTVSCEAQLKGIQLAEQINGQIDSNSSICQGKVIEKSKSTGLTMTTIGEVINKVDLIILWGANAAESIPRLLNKVLFSRGKFRMTGREIKTLVNIDPVQTASFGVMGVRDLSLLIEPNKDIELIRILKDECCAADSIPSKGVAGLDSNDLKRLLLHLTGAEYGVIFVGQGLLKPTGDSDTLKEFLELIEMINSKQKKGRLSLIMMGGHFNMMGFDHVALANYGQNGCLNFENNQLKNEETNTIDIINNEDFDLSIIVGTDPISHLPAKLSSRLMNHPIIVIDNKKSATVDVADLFLPSAITGIECEGLAYRLDNVPIQLQKILNPPNNVPSDEVILKELINRLIDGGK